MIGANYLSFYLHFNRTPAGIMYTHKYIHKSNIVDHISPTKDDRCQKMYINL